MPDRSNAACAPKILDFHSIFTGQGFDEASTSKVPTGFPTASSPQYKIDHAHDLGSAQSQVAMIKRPQ